MHIEAKGLGKRFNREIIFKNFNYTFEHNNQYAIVGPNGSGKSTLLQVIAGSTLPSSGKLIYQNGNTLIDEDDIFKYLAYAAPYLELIQEFTLLEMLQFHFKYKVLKRGETIDTIIEKAMFVGHEHKFISNFSSGMKQRLKLALAFFSECDLLLLDEPTSNMDDTGINWYKHQIKTIDNRLVIIASNQLYEYEHCQTKHTVAMLDIK